MQILQVKIDTVTDHSISVPLLVNEKLYVSPIMIAKFL